MSEPMQLSLFGQHEDDCHKSMMMIETVRVWRNNVLLQMCHKCGEWSDSSKFGVLPDNENQCMNCIPHIRDKSSRCASHDLDKQRKDIINKNSQDISSEDIKRLRMINREIANPGYVYLLQSSSGYYKIGRSKSPQNRLKTFTVKLPFEVEYIALIKTGNMAELEYQLHGRFSDKRINGEWFELSTEDIEYIRGLSDNE